MIRCVELTLNLHPCHLLNKGTARLHLSQVVTIDESSAGREEQVGN